VPGFSVAIADARGDASLQAVQTDDFIRQKVDLLLVSPLETALLTPIVAKAQKAGIPVIELGAKTEGQPGKDFTGFIGPSNFDVSHEAGVYVAKQLLPEGGEVAVLEGLPGSRVAVDGLNGFKDGVKANPKIQIIAEQPADWIPEKAENAFAEMLQAHPRIKAVYASNEGMAAGAIKALKSAGKEGNVQIVGIGGSPGLSGGISAVAKGEWAATFTYPTGAREAIMMAKKILVDCEKPVPDNLILPTIAVTRENAKEMILSKPQ